MAAVDKKDKPRQEKYNLPPTPAEKAKRSYRNQVIIIVLLLLAIMAGLAMGFIELVLPYANPPANEALMLEAKHKKTLGISTILNQSLKDAEDTSGNRTDPALAGVTLGRFDPFIDLRPEPPAPEPQWPTARYAGFVRSDNKLYAIIEVGDSTYSARPGDTLIGEILVTRINEQKVTLTYKGYQREFVLGGESK